MAKEKIDRIRPQIQDENSRGASSDLDLFDSTSVGIRRSDMIESADKLIESFARTTEEIVSLDELKQALCSGKKLTLKYGADVTAPHLHIGHAVNLWMYRELQEMGHKMVFLIGDFTTRIGDPTGKNKLRPIIPSEEIDANAEEFIRQCKMVLIDDPEVLEIRRNSEWLDKLSAGDLLQLMAFVTHNKLMSRDMFKKRNDNGDDIYCHELAYPLIQGYDSVALEADITIIGSDQLYNEMMGRFLQSKWGQTPQVIITTKITPGIDGGEKQSKSIGNYVGLSHSPRDKFGRIMTLPDSLIPLYFNVYTDVPPDRVRHVADQLGTDPMGCKLDLAEAIVGRYHGAGVAGRERDWFLNTFSQRQCPQDAATVIISNAEPTVFGLVRQCFPADQKSSSDLRRLIKQGAVKIDGAKFDMADQVVKLPPSGVVVKVGKRNWFKVSSE